MTPPSAFDEGEDEGGEVAERIFWRLLSGVEAIVYGPPALVSSWFRGDTSYGGHDPLAADPPGTVPEFVP